MNQVIILIYVHIYMKSSKSQHLTIINPTVRPDNGQTAEAPSLLIDGVLHYMCKMGGPAPALTLLSPSVRSSGPELS